MPIVSLTVSLFFLEWARSIYNEVGSICFLREPFPEVLTMSADEIRLGEMIDDYCPRCRLLLNHAVAGMAEGRVRKVTCQTCFDEHNYRHGKGGRKKASGKASLFDEVLAKMGPTQAGSPPASRNGEERIEARYISRHPTRKKKPV